MPIPLRPLKSQTDGRRRDRPLPDGTNVQRHGPASHRSGDDPGRNEGEERAEYIAKLLPVQKADFKGILKAMEGLPVTVRLLDPPLHEFLPTTNELTEELDALKSLGVILENGGRITEAMRFLDPGIQGGPQTPRMSRPRPHGGQGQGVERKAHSETRRNAQEGPGDDGSQPHAGAPGCPSGNYTPRSTACRSRPIWKPSRS